MKTKTIIASVLLLLAGALSSWACNCNKPETPEEAPKQEAACHCATKCACSDNADQDTNAPEAEEAPQEN
jgi:hypothetical protein